MRRLYLDTSLLVAALVHEAGTATAVSFLQAHAKQPLLISPWVATELASFYRGLCKAAAHYQVAHEQLLI